MPKSIKYLKFYQNGIKMKTYEKLSSLFFKIIFDTKQKVSLKINININFTCDSKFYQVKH